MMKRILFIALVCLLTCAFIGCDTSDKNSSISNPVEGEREEKEGAVMKYKSNTNTSLSVVMENNTDSVWQSGNMKDYRLEAERDGAWYEVEQKGEFANTMELLLFAPGETLDHTFEFADRYGTLSAGKYRVVKSWWANATETSEAHEFYLICEFTVE